MYNCFFGMKILVYAFFFFFFAMADAYGCYIWASVLQRILYASKHFSAKEPVPM